MKVLTIGTDRKLFEEKSPVLDRALVYASLVEEMHIIVCTTKKHNLVYKNIKNLHIHPTNSISRWFYIWSVYKIGKKIIPKFNFVRGLSVITTQDPFESGFSGFLLSRKYRLPLYIQSHTDFLSPNFKESFLNRLRLILAKFVIPRAQGMRAVSSVVKDSILNRFKKLKYSIDILPVFVDVKKINETVPDPKVLEMLSKLKFVVCMVSRLTKEKNVDLALEALHSIIKNNPYVGLVVVGDGNQRKSLQNLAEKLGIQNNVLFVGWREDVISFYKSSQMFLNTSSYEGYGMSIIEAGSSNIPMVTTQVGIAKEICKDGINASVCPVGDIGCISKAVSDLISDNAKRQLYVNNMKETLSKFAESMESYSKKYINDLEKLIK